jgi:hypothetical protein
MPQHDLAHSLAMTDVHLSRTLKAVRDEKLCQFDFLHEAARFWI